MGCASSSRRADVAIVANDKVQLTEAEGTGELGKAPSMAEVIAPAEATAAADASAAAEADALASKMATAAVQTALANVEAEAAAPAMLPDAYYEGLGLVKSGPVSWSIAASELPQPLPQQNSGRIWTTAKWLAGYDDEQPAQTDGTPSRLSRVASYVKTALFSPRPVPDDVPAQQPAEVRAPREHVSHKCCGRDMPCLPCPARNSRWSLHPPSLASCRPATSRMLSIFRCVRMLP